MLLPEVSAVAADRHRLQAEICEEKVEKGEEEQEEKEEEEEEKAAAGEEEKEEDDLDDMDIDEEVTAKDDIL
jgi:hypothetical protein